MACVVPFRLFFLGPPWRRFLAVAWLAFVPGGHVRAAPEPPQALLLAESARSLELWPAILLLEESGEPLRAEAVLARAPEFRRPESPYANLGIRRGGVWLRVAVDLAPGAPADWMFDADYPSLDRIDLYQVSRGAVVRHARLGDGLLVGERPLPTRSHAVSLRLVPGERQELLLRVETTSSMILPIALLRPADFAARESGTEALQGMLAGIGVVLIFYSLAQGIALREAVFGHYAASVAGVTFFFLSYNGLAAEHLWPGSGWLTRNAAPLAVLVALWGGLLFLEGTLRAAEASRTISRLMKLSAWVALLAGGAFVAGLIDYRLAHTMGTMLGPLPMLFGVPLAYIRVRQGERIMAFLLAGWGLYAIGVVIMMALLRGAAPSNAFTHHAFQVGSMAEMMLWIVLLGQRVAQVQRTADKAKRERESYRSLAETDTLTGLLNRRGLEPFLERAVRRGRPDRPAALFMIDLDGFKPVNDRLGHDAGDRLLVAVADRLRRTVRDVDRVARYGGDEFVVLAENFATPMQAEQLGRKLVDAFRSPVSFGGPAQCFIGLTIGVALAPHDASDAAALLVRADAAMYEGKLSGKSCVRRARSVDDGAGNALGPSREVSD